MRVALAEVRPNLSAQFERVAALVTPFHTALFVAPRHRLARVPARAVCLAGMAIECGDLLAMEKLGALRLGEASAAIAAARCVIAGEYAEATGLVPQPKKGTPQGTGLVESCTRWRWSERKPIKPKTGVDFLPPTPRNVRALKCARAIPFR